MRHTFSICSILTISIILSSCRSNGSQEAEAKEAVDSADRELLMSQIGADYLIDAQHSYLGFKIKYFGYSPVRGRFNEFDGTLIYDTTSLATLSTSVFIDISSINTGNETRDNDLTSKDSWFDAEKYPYARFQSTEVWNLPDGGFRLDGLLTIKDITKEISVTFDRPTKISRDWAGNEQIDFAGKTIINRQDFDVFGGDFWSTIMEDGLTQLSDEVELELNLHCRRPDYTRRFEESDSTDIRKITLINAKNRNFSLQDFLDSLQMEEKISGGALSTIGYTLLEWGKPELAMLTFKKKEEFFGESPIVCNQQGITYLKMDSILKAEQMFNKALSMDSVDSRANEYLRLIEKLKR